MTGLPSAAPRAASSPEDAPPSSRKFGLVVGGVLAFLFLAHWLISGGQRWWLLAIAAALIAAALVAPRALDYPNLLWFRLGQLLHKIVNPVVLGLLFFLGVTPLALVMRLFGKRLLNRTYDPAAPSYWIVRTPPGPAPDSVTRQY